MTYGYGRSYSGAVDDDRVAAGRMALGSRDWNTARSLLERVVADEPNVAAPDILDGLAEASWWCGDAAQALAARERAVGGWRAAGDLDRAVRGAVWVAIEYADALGHEAASRGWLARATTMAEAATTPSAAGWVALGHAALAADPFDQAQAAERGLAVA
jgi:hypothetical protein